MIFSLTHPKIPELANYRARIGWRIAKVRITKTHFKSQQPRFMRKLPCKNWVQIWRISKRNYTYKYYFKCNTASAQRNILIIWYILQSVCFNLQNACVKFIITLHPITIGRQALYIIIRWKRYNRSNKMDSKWVRLCE